MILVFYRMSGSGFIYRISHQMYDISPCEIINDKALYC